MKMAAKSQPKKGKPAIKKKKSKSVPKKAAAAKKSAAPKKAKPATPKKPTAKTIPLADFVSMTFLTENGVREWLKQGRLTGRQNEAGEWMIDAANLEAPHIKRVVR